VTISHQAGCVAIGNTGLLIEGAPGSGKSSLALALIDRGAVLVADDGVMLEAQGDRLVARPHPETRGLLEVRNLGLLPFPVRESVLVTLVIALDPAAPRYVETAPRRELLGVAVPHLRFAPHDPLLAIKAELALSRFGTPAGALPFASE
jgi:serine kinase of HPr protein (carbohydrate metabolism regulator)